jgi:hypothetical protein
MSNIEYHNYFVGITGLINESHEILIENICKELSCPDKVDHLKQKFIGEAIKLKKKKNEDFPKRPRSAYLFFCQDHRDKIKSDDPKLSMTDMSKKLGGMWGEVNDKGREKYIEQNQEDQYRYKKELEEYYNKNK